MPASPTTPVFVDDSGRRHRIVRVIGWFVAVIVVLYLGLLGVSLVGSPDVVPLSLPAIGRLLPGPGAPLIGTVRHNHRTSGDLLATVPRAAATQATTGPTSTSQTTAAPRTATSSATPTLSATPVATSQPVRGRSGTATTNTGTTPPRATTSPTSTTSTPPRATPTPRASSKASTHSPHWRTYTSPTPAPSP